MLSRGKTECATLKDLAESILRNNFGLGKRVHMGLQVNQSTFALGTRSWGMNNMMCFNLCCRVDTSEPRS
jgi:hypothetical protein